jgi:iron(III) transport system substrate-binding protein
MHRLMWLGVLALCLLVWGCDRNSSTREVVLYTSVDEPVARPIIDAFERQSGIKVIIKTDTEATRTAGLAERLEAEKDRPQCDVWWGNEVFHTINLAENGVLAAYDSESAKAIPAQYKDAKHRWAGTGLRARVLARNTKLPQARSATAGLSSFRDLANPALRGKIAMARPTAGTTGGHVAALYTVWGKSEFDRFFRELKANDIKLVGGNSEVAQTVGNGALWAGITDNDDVDEGKRNGLAIEPVLPDQKPGEMGTLTMPCTVGLVAGGPDGEAGKKLVDYLLSEQVEQKLLEAKFARYSVFAKEGENAVKAMEVDYAKVAGNMKQAVEEAMRILERGE